MLKSIYNSYKVELNPTNKQKEILNKNFGNISAVCLKKRNDAGGFGWRFKIVQY